jgi:hypothetical protein
MTYKSFTENVTNILEYKSRPSISFLLKEEESEFGDENMESDETTEPSTDDETDTTPDSTTDSDTETDSTTDSDTETDSTTAPAAAPAVEDDEQLSLDLENVADSLKNMTSFYDKFGHSGDKSGSIGLHSIQDFISSHVSNENASLKNKSSYGLNLNNSISYFLNEETSVKDVENDIDAVNNIIDKGSELIDKFKKGTELNINRYVDAAINAFKNFDSLFSKESIIKQAVINLIVLNSGAKAEQNIKDFEELFHEELNKQFGIEYEEYALITKPDNVAVGAVKQG